jgi:HAD superfamily hydrolase (TIGR01509 family)
MTANGIKALIFDFDGLIIDSESTDFSAWQETYRDYGLELAFDQWLQSVGSAADHFDPYMALVEATDHRVTRDEVFAAQTRRWMALTSQQPLLPGVREVMREAHALGLGLAIASSARRPWVDGHLERFGLADAFDHICTAEDVQHTKPEPDLFLAALQRLGVRANQAIVFEDSANGVLAAQRAGIFTVAVPNPMTRHLAVDGADMVLEGLDQMSLTDLLGHVNGRRQT